MDYKTNAKYFRDFNWKGPAWLIGIGLLLLPLQGIGVILILAGIGWIVYQKANEVDASVLDQAMVSAFADVKKKALDRLNIDEKQVNAVPPLELQGYVYNGFGKAKRGKDGVWRTSDASAVVIFFDDHQLYSYYCSVSLIDPRKAKKERTDEYFYRDVVSVQTATETWRPPGRAEETYDRFKLTTSGGTSVETSIYDERGLDSLRGARTLINEKKRGTT
jgi:hypothetical protein